MENVYGIENRQSAPAKQGDIHQARAEADRRLAAAIARERPSAFDEGRGGVSDMGSATGYARPITVGPEIDTPPVNPDWHDHTGLYRRT